MAAGSSGSRKAATSARSGGEGPARGARNAVARKPTSERPKTPLLEWIAAGVGLALTGFVITVIGRAALTADDRPPEIGVELLNVAPTKGGYLVELRVTNSGGRPAAQVLVEGEINTAGEAETAQTTFDYVPDHSSRVGGLFFESDPRKGEVSVRGKGFVEP